MIGPGCAQGRISHTARPSVATVTMDSWLNGILAGTALPPAAYMCSVSSSAVGAFELTVAIGAGFLLHDGSRGRRSERLRAEFELRVRVKRVLGR